MHQRGVYVRFDRDQPDWSFRAMALRFLANAAGLLLAAAIVPGIEIDDWQSLVAGTAIFAIINTLLKPIAAMLACCLIILTFGLFTIIINAAMLGLTAWASGELGLNFRVDGFWSAVFGSLIISAVSILAAMLFGRRPRYGRF